MIHLFLASDEEGDPFASKGHRWEQGPAGSADTPEPCEYYCACGCRLWFGGLLIEVPAGFFPLASCRKYGR